MLYEKHTYVVIPGSRGLGRIYDHDDAYLVHGRQQRSSLPCLALAMFDSG